MSSNTDEEATSMKLSYGNLSNEFSGKRQNETDNIEFNETEASKSQNIFLTSPQPPREVYKLRDGPCNKQLIVEKGNQSQMGLSFHSPLSRKENLVTRVEPKSYLTMKMCNLGATTKKFKKQCIKIPPTVKVRREIKKHKDEIDDEIEAEPRAKRLVEWTSVPPPMVGGPQNTQNILKENTYIDSNRIKLSKETGAGLELLEPKIFPPHKHCKYFTEEVKEENMIHSVPDSYRFENPVQIGVKLIEQCAVVGKEIVLPEASVLKSLDSEVNIVEMKENKTIENEKFDGVRLLNEGKIMEAEDEPTLDKYEILEEEDATWTCQENETNHMNDPYFDESSSTSDDTVKFPILTLEDNIKFNFSGRIKGSVTEEEMTNMRLIEEASRKVRETQVSVAFKIETEEEVNHEELVKKRNEIQAIYGGYWRTVKKTSQSKDKPILDPPPIKPSCMVGYTLAGQKYIIDLSANRPNKFPSEEAMTVWDNAVRWNALKLIREMEEGTFVPEELNNEIELKFRNMLRKAKKSAKHIVSLWKFDEHLKDDLRFLGAQREMIGLLKDVQLKLTAHANMIKQRMERILKFIKLEDLQVLFLKHPEIVRAIKMLSLQTKWGEVQFLAREMFSKIKKSFNFPKGQKWKKNFDNEVAKFNRNAKYLDQFERAMVTRELSAVVQEEQYIAMEE